ncbi:MAG: AlpA family phage regulatory protein [Rhodomicrobium sp.]
MDEDRFLRLRDVEAMTGCCRSHIYALIKAGKFPKQIRIGSRGVRWRLSDVQAWIKWKAKAA